MRQKNGFTLVEVLVAVALTGVILLTGYSAFQKIMQAQSRLGAAIDVQKNLFYTNEKLAALIREGGTIDYEEYFNRRMLGYIQGMVDTPIDTETSSPDTYTFTNFSHFGNGKKETSGQTPLYYCGFQSAQSTADMCLSVDPIKYVNKNKDADPFATGIESYPVSSQQAYGQYAALALNYDDPVGFPMPIKLPSIFETNEKIKIANREINGVVSLIENNITDVGLPELYLIKKNLNNTYTRTYFRHVYVDDDFADGDCNPTTPGFTVDGCLGKIQMTKLESCDTVTSGGANGSDGIIDAWVPTCQFNATSPNCSDLTAYMITSCPIATTIDDIYASAHEDPLDSGATPPNLTWIDVTAPDMNVIRAAFLPNPLKIPNLMVGAGDPAESPRVSVYLEVQLSTKLRNKSFVRTNMNYPRTLITTYDLSE